MIKKQSVDKEVKELRKLKKQLNDENIDLATLKNEIPKALMGKSNFTQELLSEIIGNKELNIKKLKELIKEIEFDLASKKVEVDELEELKMYVPVWREVFENASIEKKKMMLSAVIDRIMVYRDSVEINFKIHISQFVGVMKNKQSEDLTNNTEKVLSFNKSKKYGS
jgi:site-specific DNA recombinase